MHRKICFFYNDLIKHPKKPTLIRVWHVLIAPFVSTITFMQNDIIQGNLKPRLPSYSTTYHKKEEYTFIHMHIELQIHRSNFHY